jgi:hypothetical protein
MIFLRMSHARDGTTFADDSLVIVKTTSIVSVVLDDSVAKVLPSMLVSNLRSAFRFTNLYGDQFVTIEDVKILRDIERAYGLRDNYRWLIMTTYRILLYPN